MIPTFLCRNNESKLLASNGIAYINQYGANGQIYKDYFGTAPTSTVIGVLNKIATEDSIPHDLYCSGDIDPSSLCGAGSSTIAYTQYSYLTSTGQVTKSRTM